MILVIGGTGRLGRQIVELLNGQPVRVLTRDPARARTIVGGLPGVEVVGGDLLVRSDLVTALAGADVVIVTAHGGEGTGRSGPGGIEGRGLPQLIDLAATAPPKQFIYLSSASARLDSPSDFFRGKAAVENRLRTGPIPYSILRPTHLLDTWVPMLAEPLARKSRQMIIGHGRNPVSWVAGRDVAAAAARLAAESGRGRTEDLGGLQALTLRELNEQIQLALDIQPAKTTAMSPGMLRATSRILRPFNGVLARQMQLGALLDTRPQVIDSSAVWEQLGITPTAIPDWLHATLPGLLSGWGLPAQLTTPKDA